MMMAPFVWEGAPVRVAGLDGAPWFVVPDLGRVMGYANTREAVRQLDDDERRRINLNTWGKTAGIQGSETGKTGRARGNPNVTVVSESGLWALVLRSRLPSARRFSRFLRGEVLPALRERGFYALPGAAAPAPAPAADLTALARGLLRLGVAGARAGARAEAGAEALAARGLWAALARLQAVERVAILKPGIGAGPALAQVAGEQGVAVSTLENWRARVKGIEGPARLAALVPRHGGGAVRAAVGPEALAAVLGRLAAGEGVEGSVRGSVAAGHALPSARTVRRRLGAGAAGLMRLAGGG